MTDTLTAAANLREVIAGLGKGLNLPVRSACEVAYLSLSEVGSASAIPSLGDVEVLRRILFEQCQICSVSDLPHKLMKDVPLVLWNGARPAASIPGLFQAYLARTTIHKRWLLCAIEAWLRDFAPGITGFSAAGEAIAKQLDDTEHPRLLAWRILHKNYRIFDAQEGPKRLGSALLTGSKPVQTLLSETSMDDPLRSHGRFFRAAIERLLDDLPAALCGASATLGWHRAKPLLETTQQVQERSGVVRTQRNLRFEGMETSVAKACIKPWRDQRAHTSAPKADILSFLVATIGDPRLRPQRWIAVGEEETRLVRSWLSAATLEAFLSLINDAGDTSQWRYRQAFWRACLNKIPGAEVWVVLGKDLARQARFVHDLRGSFGQMNAGTQAVLLMRLGEMILSEWSNVGSLRAWDISDKQCPKMNVVGSYEVEALRAPCLEFPDYGSYSIPSRRGGKGLAHYSPQRGQWQWRAAALIRVRTGLQLQPKDYMPAGSIVP